MSDDRGVVFGDAAGGVLAAFFRAFGAGGDWKSPRSGFFAFFAGGAEGGGASSSGRSAFFFDEDVVFGCFRDAGAGGDWKAPLLAGGASPFVYPG